jgi:cation transport regulator ChaC
VPAQDGSTWVFGYGSLIWRPDFDYLERRPARVHGWQRRFWQGSHDHRGLPHAPGRVVTLVPAEGGRCDGMAYRVAEDVLEATFAALDYREKNGYERVEVTLSFTSHGGHERGVVYVAPIGNGAYLGPAPLAAIARQIAASRGPSGHNADYLLRLAEALRALDAHDPHVFDLEQIVRRLHGNIDNATTPDGEAT